MQAPNGPPAPRITLSRAAEIAARMNSSGFLGNDCMGNFLVWRQFLTQLEAKQRARP
jgi:hypothetical protein